MKDIYLKWAIVYPLTAYGAREFPWKLFKFSPKRGFAGNGRSCNLIEVEYRSHILLALKRQTSHVDSNFSNFFDAVGVWSSMGDWICRILWLWQKVWWTAGINWLINHFPTNRITMGAAIIRKMCFLSAEKFFRRDLLQNIIKSNSTRYRDQDIGFSIEFEAWNVPPVCSQLKSN